MCCDASIVVTVFNSCPLCFLFNSLCCDASILATFSSCPFCFLFFYLWLRVASGPRVKLASCKSALNPPVVCSTDRSKAVVPVLVLLFVALWFILWVDLLYVFPCVILFLCFSVILVLRLPRLGKRELILVLFVRLFDLCLFGFVGFLFLLVSGKGCGLWLWHSLDFSLTFFKALLRPANFTLGPDVTLNTVKKHNNSVRIKTPNSVNEETLHP